MPMVNSGGREHSMECNFFLEIRNCPQVIVQGKEQQVLDLLGFLNIEKVAHLRWLFVYVYC